MDEVLLGISILTILAVWHFMLRKSILDMHRDWLFDLRDEVRATFVRNGWSLDSALYKRMRDQINAYLRFTERFSFTQFVFLEKKFTEDPELHASTRKQFQEGFPCIDEGQQKYVEAFRQRAVEVMMSYMVLSSGPLLILSILMVPVVAIVTLLQVAKRGMLVTLRLLRLKAKETRMTGAALMRATVTAVASKFLYEDFVEEYSYRRLRDLAGRELRTA